MDKDDQALRIPELEGLRGLAILSVIMGHYINATLMTSATAFELVKMFLPFAWSGVDLFFVLSGFLIGGIVIDRQRSENFLKVFYIRRACRILPIYYLSVALFFSLKTFFSQWTGNFVNPLLFNNNFSIWTYLTFAQNYCVSTPRAPGNDWLGVTWSLAIEEQFYLFLPALIFLVPRPRIPWVLLCIIVLVPVLRLILFDFSGAGFYSFYFMPCRMDSLLLGVAIAYVSRSERAMNALRKHLNWIYAIAVALFLILMTTSYRSVGIFSKQMVFLGLSLICLFYASLLLIVLIHKKGIFARLTRLAFLRNLGNMSYGMYIYHLPVLELCHGIIRKDVPFHGNVRDVSVTAFAFVLVVLISTVSWKVIEQPFIALGHKFKYR